MPVYFGGLSNPNYQERAIYLSEEDNPCVRIHHLEFINLEIRVAGKPSIKGFT